MTLCYPTKKEWIDKIPAVIQKSDKTARPQTVRKENLPEFWEILNEYYKLKLKYETTIAANKKKIINNPT